MATFNSVQAFEAELRALERTVERDQRAATRLMAETAAKIARGEAARDLGGDTRFSGWTPGPDLGDLKIRRVGKTGAVVSPSRRSAGGWTVAQFGRNKGNAKGFQGPGVNRKTGARSFTKTGKVRRFRSRRWNGYTAGKGTADRTVDAAEKAADKIADRAMRTAVRKHFD